MISETTPKSFTKESLKKQFRLSEYLSEKIISGVAFLSITIIFLIFIFVFKESLPLFSFGQSAKPQTEKAIENNSKPETYGEPVEDLNAPEPETLKPETYGEPVEDLNAPDAPTIAPETYGEPLEDLNAPEPAIAEPKVAQNNEGADKTWSTFATSEWVPVSEHPRFGLIALLFGTLKVTLISMLIAGPLAVLAALYTSCFASKRKKEIIKPIIEMLAAFPSVVIGFFALMVLASLFQNLFGYESRLNAFVGGVAMALAAIPIIYTISEDALSAVPKTYSEASLALGASQWQTAFFVTLPAATPGIFAALLLGVGRVFGETMIALMATGNAALLSSNPFESVRTFAATIGSEMAETVFGETHYSVLFFIGSLLFVFSFGLNAIAEFYVKGRLIKKFQGK
ncbi:phosphate ABC transporter permease subunit PstC [Flavobacterium branchiophilum NBRC 15030 = ATCC 35035]|uniref:phosphate ABC transporter permease subunit PstC n=1 Tax=Flavobacterium branchiophilum TaxID=55197 RepID=UPI000B5B932B|nr:phosphate ABC transporter permease subunit PstC [Flavobacterium branchiophilum]OXA74618.1 phosphate ABC transporter permease subunit PstC [Flavobacterium branchiophilum NBRC 15030 = ATCC 35035]GEM54814.1 phosphate transport system permease protein [Flavobacterium branchiophilum NBRC 15030 = ATCC 35035]